MPRRDRLLDIEQTVRQLWTKQAVNEANAPKAGDKEVESYFVTFPYPYMNGRLHLGHAFSLTKAEFAARFQRLNGKNVLFPFGFHCTGMPICAAANKVKKEMAAQDEDDDAPAANGNATTERASEEDKLGVFKGKKSKAVAKGSGMGQIDVLRAMGIPDDIIPEFADPNFWLTYFPPYAKLDLDRFGLSCDWRRSFITTEMNPFYDQFIRWQFRKLKAKGYVKFGKRECVYSIAQGQPCADHDRASGEGVGPQEYTLIKMQVQKLKPEWVEEVGDAEVFLVAATLRPETMYGQTNCFVLPEGEYGFYLMNDDQVWVCGDRSAVNMYYQGLGDLDGAEKPEALLKVKGSELVGLPLSAPLCPYDTVYVLPMLTISMGKGTGIVTSVPADAPDDYAALMDWKTKAGMREKYGVKEEWADRDCVPIIEITDTDFGPMAAQYWVEKLKIESHKDKDKLAQAKKEVYMKGFYQGVLTVGPYKGMSVREAKPKVRQDMINAGQACKYFEPDGQVISRNGDECIVAFVDQWYLTYNDEEWTEKVMDHVDNNFEMFSKAAINALKHTVGWMGQWACSRQFGLGTRLPWDEKWLIESLSDSTIYMAYYTFAHLIQGGRLNGDVQGPYKIAPEDLTDDVFDYVCGLRADAPKGTKVPAAALDEMRQEFLYWYPMNLRVSGKDLIQNHLTMALFNHAAIWEKEMWPRAYYTNGHVMVDAEKMSKSKGNFLTLKQSIDQFGADATRLACADAGDGLEDANFSRETANQAILRLTTLETWAVEVMGKIEAGEYRTGELTFLDQVFANEISRLASETHKGFSTMTYRDALRPCWFDMHNARDEYRDLLNGDLHADVVRLWLEVLSIILSPVCPHICEHLWTEVLKNDGLVVEQLWPKLPAEDRMLTRKASILRSALRNFRLEKDKSAKPAKGKDPPATNKATIFVAKEYLPFQQTVLKVLDEIELDENNEPVEKDYMRKVQAHPDIEAIPKDQKKGVMPFANFVIKGDVKARGKEALELELPFDERAMLEERKDVIMRQLKIDSLAFGVPSDPCEADAKNRRGTATPGACVIVFHG